MGISRKAKLAGAVVGAALAIGVGVAINFASSESGSAETQVRVIDTNDPSAGRAPVVFGAAPQAVEHASRKAGVEFFLPADLPHGLKLAEIVIEPRPPAQAGSNLRGVTMKFRSQDRSLNLMEVNEPFTFSYQDDSHVVASPAADVKIYKDSREQGVQYTMLTPSRGYVLGVPPGQLLSDEEAIKLLSSLPMK